MGKEIFQKFLLKGLCRVTFLKVKDKSTRVLLCTLNSNYLPQKYSDDIVNVLQSSKDLDLVQVWDVTQMKWKSFRVQNVISFITEEEFSSKPNQEKDKKEEKEEKEENYKTSLDQKLQRMKEARKIIDKLRTEAQERRKLQ